MIDASVSIEFDIRRSFLSQFRAWFSMQTYEDVVESRMIRAARDERDAPANSATVGDSRRGVVRGGGKGVL